MNDEFNRKHPRGEGGRFATKAGRAWVEAVSSQMDRQRESSPNWPAVFVERQLASNPGLKLDIHRASSGHVVLSRIVVPKRSQGTGGKIMQELIDRADANGDTLALTPSGDFGGSAARLRRFYQRFGFVPNKGRNRDYAISEDMLRPPATRH